MRDAPVSVGCSLSSTFVPALHKAVGLLRQRHPAECDGDLIGRVLFAGICKVIDRANCASTGLRILRCDDPHLWYAGKIGQVVPFYGMWPEAYISRDSGGFLNRVEFSDAEIIEAPTC